MDTNFELKNVTSSKIDFGTTTQDIFKMNFTNGEETKSITLVGNGKIKTAVKA